MTHTLSAPEQSSPKVKFLGTLGLAFLVGLFAGALVMNLGFHKRLHHDPDLSGNKQEILRKYTRELNLSSEQVSEMNTALDDFAKYYDNVLSEGKFRIMKILNEEQRKKFERMVHNVR